MLEALRMLISAKPAQTACWSTLVLTQPDLGVVYIHSCFKGLQQFAKWSKKRDRSIQNQEQDLPQLQLLHASKSVATAGKSESARATTNYRKASYIHFILPAISERKGRVTSS